MGKRDQGGPKAWDRQFGGELEAVLKTGELSNSPCPEHRGP